MIVLSHYPTQNGFALLLEMVWSAVRPFGRTKITLTF
ncbi:Hypothetical protein, conserved [Brucella abortus str. 2308 A]|uniref:Uncharacterized protein n=1 Tax=Brucella abortus (strain S19) TaxID=430066 RepID=A0A0F6AVX4_BRUA1|nr:hypothetical protein BAbS19_II10400 [Brucella abortus S19]EEP61495.1 Hypothetical protein, conserved [Brucella abortus str. 2308 A]